MADSTAVETVDLSAETAQAPASRTSNYVRIGEPGELVGGGLVFLSRNRKAMLKWSAPEPKPPVHLTAEVGTIQQSIPYRAIGAALASEVIPMSQVVKFYADHDSLDALVCLLCEEYGYEFPDTDTEAEAEEEETAL